MNPPNKFVGNPVSHFENHTAPATYKIGGSVLKTPADVERIMQMLAEPSTSVIVVSAPSGVSQHIKTMFVTAGGKKVINTPLVQHNVEMILPKVKKIYTHIFGNFGIGFQKSWDERVRFFTEEFLPMQNMTTSAWCVEVFALGYFGELFTVELLVKLAKEKGVRCAVLETQQTIFLKKDFTPLPEDLFASVDIDMEKSFEAVAPILVSSRENKTPLLAAGFVAKNGLLGWNGSDTTAALLGRFYYEATGQVPRIIFQKDRPFQTSGRVDVVIPAKYSYFKREQSVYEQPFIHPQAVDLLDEPYSIPFLIEVPGSTYRLPVMSCKKLAQVSGGNPPSSNGEESLPGSFADGYTADDFAADAL